MLETEGSREVVGVTAPVLSDGTATFNPGVSEKRGSVKTYFSHALKNSDAQTDASQAVSATRQYDAFGNVLASTGVWKSQFGNAGRFGYQEDPDSGLKLLGHRYYDSSTGRFLTRDPSKDGRNWYGYCDNSPVQYFDADGLANEIVIIIGDLGGNMRSEAGMSLANLIGYYESLGYIVRIVTAQSEDELVQALVNYDQAVVFGHGSPFVYAGKGNGSANLRKVMRRVQAGRIKKGKGRLNFIVLWVCGAASPEDRELWFWITRRLWGSEGNLEFVRGNGCQIDDLFEGGQWYEDPKDGYLDDVKRWGGGSGAGLGKSGPGVMK